MRHEYKHRINYEDYLVIKSRLSRIARPDSHAGKDGRYLVHSLYFDNFSDKALREKIDGLENREKFRIRYYNDDDGYISLEKKCKIYGLCRKESAPLTRQEVIRICSGDIGFLAEAESSLLQELYAKMKYQLLRPRVLVDYEREAYVYGPGNVRVTFDSKIRTGLYHNMLFEGEVCTVPADEGGMILEVKYDAFIPEIIVKAVRIPDRGASAFSKYAACRRYG